MQESQRPGQSRAHSLELVDREHVIVGSNRSRACRTTQTIQGNPEQPVAIQTQWSSMPEWLPLVTVNQQVNHVTTSTDADRAEDIRGSSTGKQSM